MLAASIRNAKPAAAGWGVGCQGMQLMAASMKTRAASALMALP